MHFYGQFSGSSGKILLPSATKVCKMPLILYLLKNYIHFSLKKDAFPWVVGMNILQKKRLGRPQNMCRGP